MKKFLSSLLCVMLIVTMMPAAAFADGEAAVGEYRFEVGLPSQQTAWIPGINSGFWTNLEHYIEDEWGGRYWDRTDDYTVEVTAVPAPGHCENCADAEDWIVIDYHDSGRGFDLEITQEYPIGCSVDVTVKAMVDETCVAEESFMIDVTDTMYTINCENDFPDQTEMGTVIEFCGNILLKKWTIAENGEKTVTVINEEGANLPYQVVMDYDEASWIPDGDEIHGLCNLQKITPYGASAVIHLLIDGETVASSDFGVGGYEYRVEWMSDGTPHMFISEESVTVPLEKSDDLTAAENCELSFKLGVWEDDHVEPFAAQTVAVAQTLLNYGKYPSPLP